MMSTIPGLRSPCGADCPVSDDYQAHRNRTPPSQEPGVDYAPPGGEPVYAAEDATVIGVDPWPSGAPGRWVRIRITRPGPFQRWEVRYLHLLTVAVRVGQHIKRGHYLGKVGGSGWGKDWHYGAHVHVSLFRPGATAFAQSIDFQKYVGPRNKEDEVLTKAQDEKLDRIDAAIRNGKSGSHSDGRVTRIIKETRTRVVALEAALIALAGSAGADPDDIKAAVMAAVDEALADLKITLTTED